MAVAPRFEFGKAAGMRHWIKLYTEILHDPKMGRLTDRQFRTCIGLFALAGEIDADGALPPTADIAWHLRLSPETLTEDLAALAAVNVVEQLATGWLVCHWQARQGKALSDTTERVTQRVQAHRARQRDADVTPAAKNQDGTTPQCNEGVTALHCDVTPLPKNETALDKNRIDKNRDDDDAPGRANPVPDPALQAIRNAYDAAGLMLTKTHLDAHRETIQRTGLAAWQVGFAAALTAGKGNVVNYVTRCAESAMLAQQRGNGHEQPASGGAGRAASSAPGGRRARPVYDPAQDTHSNAAALRRVLGIGPSDPIPDEDD